MREIKFRAWCHLNPKGKWKYGWISYLSEEFDGVKPGYYMANDCGAPYAYEVDPKTIGQYTGLKDCNGKEIYEGDIIEILSHGIKKLHVVEGDFLFEGRECVDCGAENETVIGFSLGGFLDSYFRFDGKEISCNSTVIGNIYENPELLEKINERHQQ